MPILSYNITSNAKYFTQPQDSPQPIALDWDVENLPEQVIEARSFDVILYVSFRAPGTHNPVPFGGILLPSIFFRMADVTYNTASFPSLIRAISSLIQLNVNHSRPPPIIMMGYKERDPDERSLWGMLESEVGIRLERVGECEGWPESTPIEFWIGSREIKIQVNTSS